MSDALVLDMADSNPLARLPGYALRRAAHVMMVELADRLAPLGLRIGDASVLLLVGERTDMTSSEIGRILEIQRANMVPLLNRLAASGLIRRKPIDRKSQAILLSDAGLLRLGEVQQLVSAFEDDLMARIPPACRAPFLTALDALNS